MESLRADLIARWEWIERRCPAPGRATAVGGALLDSWAEPHRRYHDLTHLQNVLSAVDELADWADDPFAVELAAWYHDAVYDGGPGAEERSAARAQRELAAVGLSGDLVAEVARLVRLTVSHNPAPDDRNGAVLCDADLAVLAAEPPRYAAYAAAVRQEYAYVPDTAFRAGRAAILSDLLAQPELFGTPTGRSRWEAPARANLAAELATLKNTLASG